MYAYDSSRSDTIAKGVQVGGVDVGGLSAAAARAKLRTQLVSQLQKPLVLVAGEKEFPLSAREAKIQADVDKMVADAVKRGREGSIVTRTWRGITGGAGQGERGARGRATPMPPSSGSSTRSASR